MKLSKGSLASGKILTFRIRAAIGSKETGEPRSKTDRGRWSCRTWPFAGRKEGRKEGRDYEGRKGGRED